MKHVKKPASPRQDPSCGVNPPHEPSPGQRDAAGPESSPATLSAAPLVSPPAPASGACDETPPAAGDVGRAQSNEIVWVGRQLVGGLRALAGLAVVGILALSSFHPWVLHGMEEASSILPMLLLVLIFAYVVSPVVEFIHRHVCGARQTDSASRDRSLGFTYLLLAGALAILLALFVPPLVDEARTLATSLPGYSDSIRQHLVKYREQYSHVAPPALQEKLSQATSEAGRMAGSLLQQGVVYAGTLSQAVLWVIGSTVMVPLLGFYFLKDHKGILDFLLHCIDERRRPKVLAVLRDLHEAMQNFIKGQVILCLAIFGLTYVCMLFILPSYAIGLAVVAGICEAIPVIGPILGSIPAIIIAFASQGPTTALIVAVIYLGIQQTENMILVPRVMGQSLGLHPLSLILGMIVFGNVFGFWGVLLAAPGCAAVKVLVMHFAFKGGAASPALTSEAITASSEERLDH